MNWEQFVAKLKKLDTNPYDGDGDNLDEVQLWLKEHGHESQFVKCKGKRYEIKSLWDQRSAATIDMTDEAEAADEDERVNKKVRDEIASRERAGLIQKSHPHQVKVLKERIEDDPCLGYRKFDELGFGQWLQDVAVHTMCLKEGRFDQAPARLTKANQIITKQLGMNETLDGEGGFLAMPEHRTELMKRAYGVGRVFPRARQVNMTSRTMTVPYIVETSRATGSRHGGVRFYYVAEAGTLTASQPAVGLLTLNAHKAACLGYATTEIEEDASVGALQLLSELFIEELGWGMDEGVINGTGSGQPMGILNAPCLISVDREGSSAGEVRGVDLIAMWARMWAPSRANAVWFMNQDVMTDLQRLSAETISSVTELPYFLPQALGVGAQVTTLFGRPIVEIEQCASKGTVGDVILADMTQYLFGMRRGIQTAQSIHVQFLTDQTAFRATVRFDGQPWWQSALTPANGTNTQSPFICLTTA